MFNWFKKEEQVIDTVKLVRQAQLDILDFLDNADLSGILHIFNNSEVINRHSKYKLMEVRVGALLIKFREKLMHVDVELTPVRLQAMIVTSHMANRIVISERYIRNKDDAIDLLVRGIMLTLGYERKDLSKVNVIDALGRFISESA